MPNIANILGNIIHARYACTRFLRIVYHNNMTLCILIYLNNSFFYYCAENKLGSATINRSCQRKHGWFFALCTANVICVIF